VKLKMARNSLFAVLLRSPWWISFALVLLVALASRALLPEQYVLFGVMGGFPFLVIGGIAAYRQLRAPGDEEIARTMATLAAMPWNEFCGLLEQSYGQQGYIVTRLAGDAADLQLVKAGATTLLSAKRWKAANQGVEAVRALAQARSTRDASHGVYVTIAALGDNARRFAQQNQVDVLTGVALVQLVRKRPPGRKP
jgi:restriction system protein